MSKQTTGLLVGRFQPFHRGHLWLVKKMAQEVDLIKIAIGSSQEKHTKKNPLSAQERREMLKRILDKNKIKNYKIYYVPDTVNDKSWVDSVKKKTGQFDLVYSGNNWVVKLFREKKYKVVKIKEIKGISGTKIRKLIRGKKAFKKYLPMQVLVYLKSIKALARIISL